MNSILEFLLDLVYNWDNIDSYEHLVLAEPVEEDILDIIEQVISEPSTSSSLWDYYYTKTLESGIVHPRNQREQDYDHELSYNRYLESQEPGSGERAAEQAQEADLHRFGY